MFEQQLTELWEIQDKNAPNLETREPIRFLLLKGNSGRKKFSPN